MDFLKDTDLLLHVVREIHAHGVVGEDNTIICLLLKVMLRFVKNASPISSNIVLSDKSGSGKDFVASRVCSVLLPSSDYVCFTHVTEKVLAYYKIDWSGKVLHIKDPPFDLLNSSVFKTIAEGGSKALVLKGDKNIDAIDIPFKPVMIVTSMDVNFGLESLRRWDSCQMDMSPELTKAIISSKYSSSSSCVNSSFVDALKTGFKFCSVDVPFKDKLCSLLGSTHDLRTSSDKLLDYIKASAVLYQFQRERDKKGNVVASWFDFELGFYVFNHLNNVVGSPLSRDEIDLLDLLSHYPNGLSVRKILAEFKRNRLWVYRHLDLLKSRGLVTVRLEFDDVIHRDIDVYSISSEYDERQFLSCSSFRSVSFDELKRMFIVLDSERKILGLKPVFDKWLNG